MTRVSVIIAAYNAEESIRECVESLSHAITSEDEIVVCDDASSDQTLSLLEDLAAKYSNVRIIRNASNLGRAKSRNKAILASTGKYVAICDADDRALANFLGPTKELETDNRLVMASSQVLFESKILGYWILRKYPLQPEEILSDYSTNKNPMSHGGTVIRKSDAVQVGLYDANYVRAQDLDFLKRLSSRGPARNLSSIGLLYRHNVFLSYRYWKLTKVNSNKIYGLSESKGTSLVYWATSMARRLAISLASRKEANEIAKNLGLR